MANAIEKCISSNPVRNYVATILVSPRKQQKKTNDAENIGTTAFDNKLKIRFDDPTYYTA